MPSLQRFRRRFLAARLLAKNLGPPRLGLLPQRHVTPNDQAYDLYESGRSANRTLVLVYGFTMLGERDHRAVRFAQTLASGGFRVAVPVLPGLKSFSFESGDLTRLVDLLATLYQDSGRPIGLLGFSVGGGLGLTAAADPTLQGCVDPILLFGPYHSLPDFWASETAHPISPPESAEARNDYIWRQVALAYRRIDALNFTEAEKAELRDVLANYCFERSLRRKEEVYRRLIAPHGFLDLRDESVDSVTLQKLSPAGQMNSLQASIFIIHDPHDPLFPPEQSRLLLAELARRGVAYTQRLVVTPLLSHVNPRAVLRFGDLTAVLDAFGSLFDGESSTS